MCARRRTAVAWVLFGWLLAAPVETAGAAEELPRARTDSYGDPLPPGVLARLGSTRFRCGFDPNLVEISPDGRLVALATTSGQVDVFAWPSGLSVGRFGGYYLDSRGIDFENLQTIRFSDDSKRLLLLANDCVLEYDIFARRYATRLRPRQWGLRLLSPDGRYVVSEVAVAGPVPSFDLYHYDLRQKNPAPRRLGSGMLSNSTVAISRDSRWLAIIPANGPAETNRLSLMDLRTGRVVHAPSPNESVSELEFAPDGRSLISVGADLVVMHSLALPEGDGKTPAKIGPARTVLADLESTPVASYVSGGRELLLAGAGGRVSVVDAATLAVRKTLNVGSNRSEVRLSPDGRWLASLSDNGSVPKFFGVADGGEILTNRGHRATMVGLVFSADGRTLYSSSLDGTVKTWNVAPYAANRLVSPRSSGVVAEERRSSRETLTRQVGGQFQLGLHLDEARHSLIAQTDGGQLVEWDLRDRKPYALRGRAYNPWGQWVTSDDGVAAASLAEDFQSIDIRDMRSDRSVSTIRTSQTTISMAFHPDGRTFLTSDEIGDILAWDLKSGKSLATVPGFAGGLARRVWIDRHFLDDGELVVRDRATGLSRFSMAGNFGGHSLSRDERVLVAIRNQQVERYELPGGAMRKLPTQESMNAVFAVAVSPDGTLVAVGYGNGEIHLLDERPRFRDADRPATTSEWQSLWAGLIGPNYDPRVQGSLLRQFPAKAVEELGRRRILPTPPDRERVAALLKQLDDDRYARREAAMRELRRNLTGVLPILEAHLKARPTAEVEGRLRRLIRDEAVLPPTGERLRNLRTIGLLEAIGTPEAAKLLREYAAVADPMLSTSAKDSLVRMKQ